MSEDNDRQRIAKALNAPLFRSTKTGKGNIMRQTLFRSTADVTSRSSQDVLENYLC